MKRFGQGSAILFLAACGGTTPEGGDDDDTGDDAADTSTSEDAEASTDASNPDTTDAGDSTSDGATTDEGESSSGTDTGASEGCEGVTLRPNPADAAARGPWAVGASTQTVDDLTLEIWYPAVPGSERGQEPAVYDIREQLPESEQDNISDEDNPAQLCDCHRDLPIDDAYGPYPVIVFVHGTASFRTQSLPQMTHWASRGFVVIAADHPGLRLADMLGMLCGGNPPPQDLDGDLATILAAVRGEVPGLEDFTPILDATRIGMAGHSAGGNAVGDRGDEARVIIPLAAGGTSPGAMLESTLVMGGTDDSVVAYSQQQNGFESSPSPKRLVGIEAAGHLSFSEICSLRNAAGDDLLEVANANGVCGVQFAGFLFQCSEELIPDPDAWDIVNFATAATFEETLQCSSIGASFAEITTRFPAVSEFRQE